MKINIKKKEYEGYSLVSLIEIYCDASVNPNGNYELDISLIDGEQSFCESYGYKYSDWLEVKQIINSLKSLQQ